MSLEIPIRHELKYVIPAALVEPICHFIRPYCEEDKYSQLSPDGTYPITSLYLDTPQDRVIHSKFAGLANRYSLRVRSYSTTGAFPYFLEIKQKVRGFTKKMRCALTQADWNETWDPEYPDWLGRGTFSKGRNYDLFLHLTTSIGAKPKYLTQYRRRAFFSLVDDYARVTFDSALRYQLRDFYDLCPYDPEMLGYDHEICMDQEDSSVVLELKSTPQIPIWMSDLVATFGLEQGGFSKFGNAYLDQLERHIQGGTPHQGDLYHHVEQAEGWAARTS